MALSPNWITFNSFQRIGFKPHHGINIHLSSLRTEKSSGIGEFYDLIPLIDWCKEVGFDIIQLLPLNDTGNETSPYSAITSCGLNPIFLSLHKLPYLDQPLETFIKFNRLPKVAYEAVLHDKLDFLQIYYQKKFPRLEKSKDYQKFVASNGWLDGYARFKMLNTPGELSFFTFLQYLCYIQLQDVKRYANKKGIFLKGDIPILISTHSADVWTHQKDFNTNFSAGSPPDQFSHEGQEWGFPLYNWDEIKKDDFQWWKNRLKYAENFYDLYRLDHIQGFFRIWAVPKGKKPTEGFFIPNDPIEREKQGSLILTNIVPTTTMLPIGEDLGVEIVRVQAKMEELGIPGTRVVRWTRNYNTDRSFIPYNQYPKLSVCTLSTHDSETLALWWKNHPADVKAFSDFRNAPYEPTLSQTTRYAILKEVHKSSSLFHINLLGEYLALFDELIWENPDDERINIPGTILPTNWTYRLRPSLEELISHKSLKIAIKSILS